MPYTLHIRRLERRFAGMPMFKVLLPFASGVLPALHFQLPFWFLATLLLVSGVAALLTRRSLFLMVLLGAVGMVVTSLHLTWRPLPDRLRSAYLVEVDFDSAKRTSRYTAEGRLIGWRDPTGGRWHRTEGRLLLHTDSALLLQGGERLLFEGRIYPFRSGSANFLRLMHHRGYLGSCYLSERNLLEREEVRKPSLHLAAARLMQRRCSVEDDASAVVRAMCVGDRSGIHSELRTAYARSGMSHLLAVSGLHTGIVFMVINLVLWWLPLVRRGHILRNLIAIVALWVFVAAAGFPPSAIRAAVMCTLLQGALASSSHYQAMNAWSASALVMLLWNPRWLGDISFQLSFVAVAAILLWGVPLCRRCRSRFALLNSLLHALIIGLTASIATAPLVSYAFGMVPIVGLLLNPPVVALGTVVVAGGLLALLLPPLSEWLLLPTGWAAEGLNRLAAWAAAPEAGVAQITLSAEWVATIYLLFLLFTFGGWCLERKKSVHLSYDDPRSLSNPVP